MQTNTTNTNPTYIVKKKQPLFSIIVSLFLFICFFASIALWYVYPSFQQAFLDKTKWTLVYDDMSYPGQAVIIDEKVLISLSFVKENLDEDIFWDAAEATAVISTGDKLVLMNTQQLTAHINNNPVDISTPVKIIEDAPFLPVEILAQLYHLEVGVADQTKRIIVVKQGVPQVIGNIISPSVPMREEPVFRSARLTSLSLGDQVVILGEFNGFYLARTTLGIIGYLDKGAVEFGGVELTSLPIRQSAPWRPMGEKINLTWEHVMRKNPDTSQLAYMPGLNVVSPTWFHLKDDEGNLQNNADIAYVNWAHANGYQVWGLVTNDFNRDRTHQVLSSTATRQKVINQLLIFAQLYSLDGINIDFENMHLKDRDLLTQFVRELTPLAHEQGLTVSIDVTIRSTSENWSMIYDRPALGKLVDYLIVMTYDEHWASSPKAGSVASLPWVERGLVGILEQVPKEKVVLGIPFYTRLWEEKKQADGSIKVSSRALSMAGAEKLVAEKGAQIIYDEKAQQDYAQWTEGSSTFKIWLENESSIAKRVQLVNKYDLAGVASWRRGFEKPIIWQVIQEELSKR